MTTRAVALGILFGYASIAFFGFTGVSGMGFHDTESAGGSACIVSLLRGAPCPLMEDTAASVAFHIGGLKVFTTATAQAFPWLSLLALVAFGFAAFAAFGSEFIFRFRFAAQGRAPSRPAGRQRILHWFSKRFHSPPF